MRWTAAKLVPYFCVAVILGAALYSIIAPRPHTALDDSLNHKTVLEGVVVADPTTQGKGEALMLKIDDVTVQVTGSFAGVSYGDRVRATGTLKLPMPFDTNGRTFDYPKYLRAQSVLYEMPFAQVSVIGTGAGNPVVASLLSIKHVLLRGIATAVPAPESDLLAGLLIGEKRSLGDTLTAAFRRAGVIHIIVLSGYNVSVVMNAVIYTLSRILPRLATYGASALFVIGFAVMTGASETTMRAVLMALIMLVATLLRRPADALRVLLIAAAAMALWNPFIVLYDLSFQLSVLATLGLILFSEPIANHLKFVPEFKHFPLREILSTTLATQVVVLPLLILSMGQVSLVFLATNPLILPTIPLAMLLGFIASLAALVSPIVALPFSFVSYLILHYIIAVASWFGSLPFAALIIPAAWGGPSLVIVAALYALFFVYYFRKRLAMMSPFKFLKKAST